MLKAIKELLGSKKFLITLLGTVVVFVLTQLQVPSDIIIFVAGLFGVNVAGVGMQDFGKAAKEMETSQKQK